MSAADAAVGMMDGAYFVGRRELLDFYNNLLDLNLNKIEQTAPGHIACQMTDLIFPGSVPMARVNWEARSDFEYVQNYKLLQAAFNKHRVQRHVDVDKLIRAKYQDNLEFCQWLKAFYDQAAAPRVDYDPAAVRAKGKGGKKFNQLQGSGMGRGPRTIAGGAGINGGSSNGNGVSPTRVSRPLRERGTTENKSKPMTHTRTASTASSSSAVVADAQLSKENAELTQKVQDLEVTIEDIERERDQIVTDVEKERDFYFGKLRSIEVMLQVHQDQGAESDPENLVDRVFQILYATAEDNLTVNADGQVVEASTTEDDLDGSAGGLGGVGGEALDELLLDNP